MRKNARVVSGIVTIDVEPDNVWENTQSRSLENMKHLLLFHRLCQEYGVRPTYLVSWSVASDAECTSIIETLLSNDDCEVGIHPHLWETPPLLPQDAGTRAWVGPDYPMEALEGKLTNITDLIRSRFGVPISHRAGRWGMDTRQIGILLRLGIEIDTSVTPGIDLSTTGAPDYTDASSAAYRLGSGSLVVPGDGRMLEVPCTVRPGWRLRGWEDVRYIRSAVRVLGFGHQWLRASPTSTVASLEKVCAWARARYSHLNLMSHSSEFMPGGSPYWRTEAEVARHLDMYRWIFSWWRDQSVVPQTLSEFSVSHRAQAVNECTL